MAIQDQFILQPSNQFNINGRQEADQGLELYGSPTYGSVTGTVTDANGDPIADATVKLFTANNVPFEHTNTNASGVYLFDQIPAGNYTITASMTGYLTPNNIPVGVIAERQSTVNIAMQPDPNVSTLTIYGIISDTFGNPVEGASVDLFMQTDGGRVAVGSVITNSQGQYLFTELGAGTYIIVAGKFGYLPVENWVGALTPPGFQAVDLAIAPDPNGNTGTVSGVVKDHLTGQPVGNAIVALYLMTGQTERIVNMTRTNALGVYLFGNVGPGNYRVKATVQSNV
ncbi:carboxypeptidase-like regulatory domain-containing protein [Paenibacillus thiaminolyticus]|nr:carboxypeptidase-like regulatory domain-containing protein [Paenibacillus thiaminolyticus]MCY9536902.1 carboxypeptidase-like regulatory domain-containing protein [Paenibacillus thiaminolyticus]MCY9605078.1 carboxypeptidase-like regulatory domain-containing protein [Paenibacillus thiaminolyticus]MCY9607235.1 carboxypeptidase-like regulatory domain-containing protein [Paenibacillus thiaminolyticus]MCY9616359.1 carboxypeptidase-like regulatory domain-containing protein [Paenibacillus thiaminoly